MNCIIIEWWKFNHDPKFWIELAKEHKMSLHVSDEDDVIITNKEEE